MTRNITSELVIKFHKYMAKTFDFTIQDKSEAIEMKLISNFICKFTPIDPTAFLSDYSTTIYGNVYIPYSIGSGNKQQLFSQIKTITHEAQHVADFRSDVMDLVRYLAFESDRTRIETKALSTSLYLQWWYNETIPNLSRLVDNLYYYGLEESDRRVALKKLRLHTPIVRKGKVLKSLVAAKAIAWLNRNCK